MVVERMVVLKNKGSVTMDFRVYRELSPDGEPESRFLLEPDAEAEFPAKIFNRRGKRGATIKVYVNGSEVRSPFLPESFYRYVKIFVDVVSYKSSESGGVRYKLVVTGVRPKYTDICRLRGFGFLGRKYAGREPEPIE